MLCSRKFLVSTKLKKKRGIPGFPVGKLCLTLPKIFVGEPFPAVFQKISGIAENYGEEGVGYQDFTTETFLSHSAEKIHWGTHSCFTLFGYRQILCFRGLSQDFLSKIFCLTVPKSL